MSQSSMPGVGQICWSELATPNVKEAKAFYSNMFGWEFKDHCMDDNTYTMIKCGEKEFGGIWCIPSTQVQDIPPHWMNYILVESLEKSLEDVKKYGGTVKVPLQKCGDFGQFAVIVDPTGAHIALWESLKDC